MPADCLVCGAARIPGVGPCVNCGEPGTLPDACGEAETSRAWVQRITEGRALEYAGDVAGALSVYEALLRDGVPYSPPYRRLAILYRKGKQPDEEARVVRQALARFSGGPGDWFVLRYAAILARHRLAP